MSINPNFQQPKLILLLIGALGKSVRKVAPVNLQDRCICKPDEEDGDTYKRKKVEYGYEKIER